MPKGGPCIPRHLRSAISLGMDGGCSDACNRAGQVREITPSRRASTRTPATVADTREMKPAGLSSFDPPPRSSTPRCVTPSRGNRRDARSSSHSGASLQAVERRGQNAFHTNIYRDKAMVCERSNKKAAPHHLSSALDYNGQVRLDGTQRRDATPTRRSPNNYLHKQTSHPLLGSIDRKGDAGADTPSTQLNSQRGAVSSAALHHDHCASEFTSHTPRKVLTPDSCSLASKVASSKASVCTPMDGANIGGQDHASELRSHTPHKTRAPSSSSLTSMSVSSKPPIFAPIDGAAVGDAFIHTPMTQISSEEYASEMQAHTPRKKRTPSSSSFVSRSVASKASVCGSIDGAALGKCINFKCDDAFVSSPATQVSRHSAHPLAENLNQYDNELELCPHTPRRTRTPSRCSLASKPDCRKLSEGGSEEVAVLRSNLCDEHPTENMDSGVLPETNSNFSLIANWDTQPLEEAKSSDSQVQPRSSAFSVKSGGAGGRSSARAVAFFRYYQPLGELLCKKQFDDYRSSDSNRYHLYDSHTDVSE